MPSTRCTGKERDSSTPMTPRARSSLGLLSMVNSTRPGGSRSLPLTSDDSAAISWWETSATDRSTPSGTANGRFEHRGELRDTSGKTISIDGLWALQFGHGSPTNGPTNTLFFTAGPNDESDGLFGSITAP